MNEFFSLLKFVENLSIGEEVSDLKSKEVLLSIETINELQNLIGSFKYTTKKEKKKAVEIIEKYKKDIANLIDEHEKLVNKLHKDLI